MSCDFVTCMTLINLFTCLFMLDSTRDFLNEEKIRSVRNVGKVTNVSCKNARAVIADNADISDISDIPDIPDIVRVKTFLTCLIFSTFKKSLS